MDDKPREHGTWLRSPSGIVFLVFLGVAAVFLVMEHTGHVLGALPYLLLLACPLMHFLHRGHRGGGHGGHG